MGLRETLEAATPGPWEVDAADGSLDVRAPEHKTATVWVHLAGPWTMGADAHADVKRRAMADAELVALAPELAALVLDMGELLADRMEHGYLPGKHGDFEAKSLLARLDSIGKEQT